MYTTTLLGNDVYLVEWPALDSGEWGEWLQLPGYPYKTVQISGPLVTTVVMQGSNEDDGANPVTLKDIDGSTSINAAGIYTLKDNPLAVRPNVTTGNKVLVTMICWRNRGT